jgi:hypothetical protein
VGGLRRLRRDLGGWFHAILQMQFTAIRDRVGCLNSFGILVKNRLLARAAQNGVSMFVSVYRAGPRGHPARERSFRDVPPDTV